MAIRNVLTDPDETLTKKSRHVERFDNRLLQLVEDMKETLEQKNGVGLAAPQVGVLRRVFVINTKDADNEGEIMEFINPEIIRAEGEQAETEGCLSCPGIWGVTLRPMKVTVRAFNINGDSFEYTGEGLMARALCHENDHLDGILYKQHVVKWVEQ